MKNTIWDKVLGRKVYKLGVMSNNRQWNVSAPASVGFQMEDPGSNIWLYVKGSEMKGVPCWLWTQKIKATCVRYKSADNDGMWCIINKMVRQKNIWHLLVWLPQVTKITDTISRITDGCDVLRFIPECHRKKSVLFMKRITWCVVMVAVFAPNYL